MRASRDERADRLVAAIASELRAAQGRADINDSELARRMGRARSSVRKWLRGEVALDSTLLDQIARAIGTTPEEVFHAARVSIDGPDESPGSAERSA